MKSMLLYTTLFCAHFIHTADNYYRITTQDIVEFRASIIKKMNAEQVDDPYNILPKALRIANIGLYLEENNRNDIVTIEFIDQIDTKNNRIDSDETHVKPNEESCNETQVPNKVAFIRINSLDFKKAEALSPKNLLKSLVTNSTKQQTQSTNKSKKNGKPKKKNKNENFDFDAFNKTVAADNQKRLEEQRIKKLQKQKLEEQRIKARIATITTLFMDRITTRDFTIPKPTMDKYMEELEKLDLSVAIKLNAEIKKIYETSVTYWANELKRHGPLNQIDSNQKRTDLLTCITELKNATPPIGSAERRWHQKALTMEKKVQKMTFDTSEEDSFEKAAEMLDEIIAEKLELEKNQSESTIASLAKELALIMDNDHATNIDYEKALKLVRSMEQCEPKDETDRKLQRKIPGFRESVENCIIAETMFIHNFNQTAGKEQKTTLL